MQKLEEGWHLCFKCKKSTMWTLVASGNRLRCQSCKDVYPCYIKCEHIDCEDIRKGQQIKTLNGAVWEEVGTV